MHGSETTYIKIKNVLKLLIKHSKVLKSVSDSCSVLFLKPYIYEFSMCCINE